MGAWLWFTRALLVTAAVLLPIVPLHAQQRATIYPGAPVYGSPNTNSEPLFVAGENSTAYVVRAEGAWFRISFEDSRKQLREGYVQATFVTISQFQRRPEREPRPPARNTAPTSRGRLKDVKIRGYVTEFRSPTDFDIEDYRITRDEAFPLDFENASPYITFQPGDIRVGVELEIKGTLNEQTGELKARSIKVDLEQFMSLKQTAFLSRAPEGIQRLDGSWAGELRADGQIIRVTKATMITFKPTKREKRLAELARYNGGEELDDEAAEPLQSLDQVTAGMAMTYEGRRDRETGKVLAEKIEFSTNDLEDGEASLWKSLKVSVKEADGLRPGELKIDEIGKFKLVPDAEVQAYVSRLGERLIPAYQRELPANDPRRIPFRFYVVQDDSVNAFATPNGIVVVNSGLMEMLENEAQLAAVMGHEIAHATHEHSWRAHEYRNAAIVNGHTRSQENQSDRIGLEYMTDAGYDPREAPAVWKALARNNGVSSTEFFWSSHDNEPTRRSYLMNELKNNYRDLDVAALRIDAEEYSRIRAAVIAANGKKDKQRK